MNMKEKIIWVDSIRIIAVVLVVMQHVATPLVFSFNKLLLTDWWIANLYHSLTNICVPLLFMISGYLLLNKNDPINEFVKKRILKVIIPLIAWTIIYLLWNRYYYKSIELNFIVLTQTLIKPAQYHLWFLYAIIGLYLLIPIINIFIRHSTDMMQYYLIILWISSVSIFPFIEKTTHIEASVYDLKIFSGYIGYLILGYILGNLKIDKKYISILIFAITILIGLTAIATYFATTRNHGVLVKYFYTYLSPNVILLSAISFVFLKTVIGNINFDKHHQIRNIIIVTSSASFGIYLIHVIILNLLKYGSLGITFTSFTFNALYNIPALTFIITTVSFGIIYLLQKIPILKKCVP